MTFQARVALGAMVLALCVPVAHAAIDDAKADKLMKVAGCIACHGVDKKIVGPTYKEVAVKRKGDATAAKKIETAVRNGSKGVYGNVPMPPTPPTKISDADLRALIEWLLKK